MNDLSRVPVRDLLAPSAVVENVAPQVDGGRFAVKRVVGEEIVVTADCFAHGHEGVSCEVRYKGPGDTRWTGVAMQAVGNDRWSARFTVDRLGMWQYGVVGWIDRPSTPRAGAARSVSFPAWVDRERARFGSWYECFPRSMAAESGTHGTFADVERNLDRIQTMGFDVLHLPPIHPIGRAKRRGRNNATVAEPFDVGNPWVIGAREGGHTAIHPELGTHEDFRRLVRALRDRDMEIALDIAFRVAPDHPWMTQHPEWFRRTGASVQPAGNPPSEREDTCPIDFETRDWRGLWQTLREVIEFWIGEGVEIFRVDDPHDQPFAFWEWLIAGIRSEHPRVIFLSGAIARPRVMHRLAKLGFTQSCIHFAWHCTKQELIEDFTGLTRTPAREYFRPSCWPNTPDILPRHLRHAPREAFAVRYVLAATLAANCGIYGPAFELAANEPRDDASEEYATSEKHEIKRWDVESPASLAPLIARVNAIRHGHPALQSDWSLAFHATDNDALLCYSKRTDDDRILVAVNLDPVNAQSGWIDADLAALGLDGHGAWTVHDLLSGERYPWWGSRNFLKLDPRRAPAHVLAATPGHT